MLKEFNRLGVGTATHFFKRNFKSRFKIKVLTSLKYQLLVGENSGRFEITEAFSQLCSLYLDW